MLERARLTHDYKSVLFIFLPIDCFGRVVRSKGTPVVPYMPVGRRVSCVMYRFRSMRKSSNQPTPTDQVDIKAKIDLPEGHMNMDSESETKCPRTGLQAQPERPGLRRQRNNLTSGSQSITTTSSNLHPVRRTWFRLFFRSPFV